MTRLLALLLIAAMPAAAAQLPVFAGDPIDPTTGVPYIILPGVPLVNPGPDGRFGNRDDIIDPSIIGDVDLVVRTGGGYTGGPIPAPHAGVAAAPAVVAGGTATGSGTTVAFQGIVSDGQPPFATGNPLTGPELDGRPLLAVAYADLDGDGFIGPTATDGDADDEIERQEIVVPAGRAPASIVGGIAGGSLALTVGAPASAGGLGIVVTAGAATGTTPFLYFYGPLIATLLPDTPPSIPSRSSAATAAAARIRHTSSPTSSWSSRKSPRGAESPDSRDAVRHPARRHQPDGGPGAQREWPGIGRGVRQDRRSGHVRRSTPHAGYSRRSGRRARARSSRARTRSRSPATVPAVQ